MSLVARDPQAPAVVPQGTAAWVRERIGHLTASNMAKAIAFKKDGKETAERAKLKAQVIAERMVDGAVDHYVTPEMEWGLMYEHEAQAKYAELSGRHVTPGGFVHHRTIEFFGASPDSFVDHDGLLETKCPKTETHIGYMLAGVVPEDYQPQMLAQIACTGRKWVDFCSYDPRIKDERRRIFIRRFEPRASEIAEIECLALKFLAEVDAMFEALP